MLSECGEDVRIASKSSHAREGASAHARAWRDEANSTPRSSPSLNSLALLFLISDFIAVPALDGDLLVLKGHDTRTGARPKTSLMVQ